MSLTLFDAEEDVPIERCSFRSIQDVLKNIFGVDDGQVVLPYHPDKQMDTNAILKVIAFLISPSQGISVNKTIDQVVRAQNEVYSKRTSADLDSLIFTYSQLDKLFRHFFQDLVECAKNNKYMYANIEHIYEANDTMNTGPGAKPDDLLDNHAKILVDIAYTNGLIGEQIHQIVTPLAPYLPVGPKFPSTKSPTIGSSRRVLHQFMLPSVTASEPVHAWIITWKMPDFRKCVARIAWYLNWYYPTSVTKDNAFKMTLEEGDERNKMTTIGGLWVFRLAFILYCFEFPTDKNTRYIEETYNMKKRSIISYVPRNLREWSNSLDNPKDVLFNMFGAGDKHLPSEASDDMARQLSSRLCSNPSQVQSMFSFYFQGMLNGVVVIGIGVQTSAYNADGKAMFIGQKESLSADNGQVSHINYVTGGLGPGLGGFTEQSVHVVEIVNNSRVIQARNGIPTKLPIEAEKAMNKLHGESNTWVVQHVRTQTYYPFYRYITGGNENDYMDRMSTAVKLVNSRTNNIGDVRPTLVVNQLKQYADKIAHSFQDFRRGNLFRSEIAYACNGLCAEEYKERNNPLGKYSRVQHFKNFKQFQEDRVSANKLSLDRERRTLQESIHDVLQKPIKKALHNVKDKVHVVDASVIANYSISVLNAYLYSYYVSLVALMRFEENASHVQEVLNPNSKQVNNRVSICLFIRYLQDFLAIFLSGTDRREFIGKDAFNKPRYYVYKVFNKKTGKKLNRTYSVLPTFPDSVVDILKGIARGSVPTEMEKIQNARYVITKSFTNASTDVHARKWQDLCENGRPKSQSVVMCCHPNCKEKYFLSSDLLHEHIAVYDDAKEDHRGEHGPALPLTGDIVQHMYDFVLNTCTEEQKHVVKAVVTEGQSCILSGDGGTGKSVLMKKILRLLWLRENDGVPRKDHKPGKVLGAAMQLAQAFLANHTFTTMHKLLGVEDIDIPFASDEEERIVWAMNRFLEEPGLKIKLRYAEVIVIEEFGMVPNFVGDLLQTMLNVARGRLKPRGDAYGTKGGKGEEESEEEEEEMESDCFNSSRLHAVQLFLIGQCSQLPPIKDEKRKNIPIGTYDTWSINQKLNDRCRCFHLSTPFRYIEADDAFKGLVLRARTGEFSSEDIQFVIQHAGSDVKRNLGLLPAERTCLDNYVKVTHVVYTHERLYVVNEELERDLINRGLVTLTEVLADDSIESIAGFPFSQEFSSFEIHTLMNTDDNLDLTGGTNLLAVCKVTETNVTEHRFVKPTCNKSGNYSLNRSLNKVGPKELRIFDGMPVIFTDTLHKVPLLSNRYDMSTTIAKNTQGVIKSFDLKSNEIIVKVSIESNSLTIDGRCHFKPVEYVITRKSQSCNVLLNGHTYSFKRFQFPLKTGLCISWSLVQGLTIPYLCLDITRNTILYDSPMMNFSALWYVTLSRVRNLKCIYLSGMKVPTNLKTGDSVCQIWRALLFRFFQRVNPQAACFEKKYIEQAQTRLEETSILKANSQITLVDHMNKNFNAGKNFLSSCSELSAVYTNLGTICLNVIQLIEQALSNEPGIQLHPQLKRYYSNKLNKALSDGKAQSLLLETEVSKSLPVLECFSWLAKFCESKLDISNSIYMGMAKLVTFGKVNSTIGGLSELSTSSSNSSAAVVNIEFRYLRSRLSNPDNSIVLEAIIEEDILHTIYAVLEHIKECAKQVTSNPIDNPQVFVESYRQSNDEERNKRQRVSAIPNPNMISQPKLIPYFTTVVNTRFLTIETIEDFHKAINKAMLEGVFHDIPAMSRQTNPLEHVQDAEQQMHVEQTLNESNPATHNNDGNSSADNEMNCTFPGQDQECDEDAAYYD